MEHTGTALCLQKNAGLTLKVEKSAFFTSWIDCSGHIIRPSRLEDANHTADAICKLKTGNTVTELRSFLD